MSTTRPLPTVIGPTENALRALLAKVLSATQIKTYSAWVILNAAAGADATKPNGDWRPGVADALKVDLEDMDDVLAQLRTAGMLGKDDSLTAFGAAELATGRSVVAATTAHLVDGISEEERTTARRALDHIRLKANELLRM